MGLESLYIEIPAELKKVLGENADRENRSLTELIVQHLAKALNRPDLAQIPRRRAGRPRKVIA